MSSSHRRLFAGGALTIALTAGFVSAQTPMDEESPWPRVRSTNGNTVTLHLPQVERWTSNWFSARAAVEVKPAKAKEELLGVVWFEAKGSVDRVNRLVTLDRLEITKARFPDAEDNGSNAIAIVREVLPSGARTVSLDYLIAALGFEQAAARQGPAGLRHTPPEIIWATNRTVLVLIDGEPALQPIPGAALERVINTPALLVHDKANAKYYLAGDGQWFVAASIKGPWSLAQSPPDKVTALTPASTNGPAVRDDGPEPRIIVSTSPAELLMTGGLPDFRPIRGTALQYAADTDSQLFFDTTDSEAYLLVSGRWFKAKSLNGPWNHVAPSDLPADFARIPPGSAQAVVLASVPDTPQAELAVVANSVPTTATVSRRDAKIQLSFDGEPKFKPIDGTSMSYAVNAQLPVIRTGDLYYALDDGVWFVASSATGSWEVATEVPEVIYTIPPSSPVYYATFARVYQATDDEVEVGYTPGYQGAYEDEGTVVYGTGWNYEPWSGDEYYGWGWTWGYSYVYVPWYQWWVWRPWWNQPGGLRATQIENIYNRWQGRSGITHFDGAPSAPLAPRAPSAPSAGQAPPAGQSPLAERAPLAGRAPSAGRAPLAPSAGYAGYPAVYGRFKGPTTPAAMSPPPNTLALNPYSRPQASVRPGEIPRGAQLLSTVRKAPGGGRDLYASPDGSIYRRKDNGWYRRQAGGGWAYFAPTQGSIERDRLASARGRSSPSGDAVYRPTARRDVASPKMQARGNRVPDTGFEARANEVANLERQYYARSLGQTRAQNWRPSRNFARPTRPAGGRR